MKSFTFSFHNVSNFLQIWSLRPFHFPQICQVMCTRPLISPPHLQRLKLVHFWKKENFEKRLVAKSKGEWKEDPKEMLLMTFCNSRTKKEGKGESRAFGEAHRLLARTLLIIENLLHTKMYFKEEENGNKFCNIWKNQITKSWINRKNKIKYAKEFFPGWIWDDDKRWQIWRESSLL